MKGRADHRAAGLAKSWAREQKELLQEDGFFLKARAFILNESFLISCFSLCLGAPSSEALLEPAKTALKASPWTPEELIISIKAFLLASCWTLSFAACSLEVEMRAACSQAMASTKWSLKLAGTRPLQETPYGTNGLVFRQQEQDAGV